MRDDAGRADDTSDPERADPAGGTTASQASNDARAPVDPELRADDGPRTRGFLFCDLRGYTAYVEAHGDRAGAALLDRYRALVRAAVARSTGAEIRTEGDAFYIVFPSASSAVRCGLDVVAAAAGAGTETPDRPIRVGVGIHAGESIEAAEGYVGSAVNIAARVCAVAEPGEVLVTETVRALVRTSLDVSFMARGRPRLKGIDEPIALYRVTTGPVVGRAAVSGPTIRGRAGLPLAIGAIAVIVVALAAVRLVTLDGAAAPPSPPASATGASGTALRSPVPTASDVRPAVAPLTGRLAFFATQVIGTPQPRRQLYVAEAAGGGWKRMTELTADVFLASWSPDGSALVYTVGGSENAPPRVVEVATAPEATQHPWPFATDVVVWEGRTYLLNTIDWSPSGELFVCAGTVDVPASARIFAVSPDGSTVRLVTEPDPAQPGSSDDCGPSVSPDGLTVGFASGIATLGIWASPAKGAGERLQLTEDIDVRPAAEAVSWSPDGSRMVFAGQHTKGGPIEIWTMDAQGTSLRRLTEDDVTDEWPAFSPDGRSIAWTRTIDGQRQVWVMDADGSDQRPLLVGAPGEQLDLVGWAPDPD